MANNSHRNLHDFAARHQWQCLYCKQATHCGTCNPGLNERLAATRDHRIPRARGGSNSAKNLVLACFGCNQDKGSKLIEEALPDSYLTLAVVAERRATRQPRRQPAPAVHTPQVWLACSDGWHKTEQQAVAACAALLTATSNRFTPYQCAFCQRWHVQRVAA